MDPGALVRWLPPGEMTGTMHRFEGRVGGGYHMSLFYPPEKQGGRGKTTAREDRVAVTFITLDRPHRIVETVQFETDDPALLGEMTITITFEAALGGTEVTFLCENLPPGLRPEDNETGSRQSLEQLARYLSQ